MLAEMVLLEFTYWLKYKVYIKKVLGNYWIRHPSFGSPGMGRVPQEKYFISTRKGAKNELLSLFV